MVQRILAILFICSLISSSLPATKPAIATPVEQVVLPSVTGQQPISVFFDDLTGFDTVANSPPIVVSFDDIPSGTDVTGTTFSGVTFDLGDPLMPSAPLIIVPGDQTFTPPEFLNVSDPAVHKLLPTSGANVLSPGGLELAPGPNPVVESDSIRLMFDTPASAVGFDILFQQFDCCSFVGITVRDAAGEVLFSRSPIPAGLFETETANGFLFVGFVSRVANIKEIEVIEFDSDNNYADSNIGYDSLRLRYDPILEDTSIVDTGPIVNGFTAGTLAGNFEATPDGAATYTIPLWVPQGRAGMQPDLSLFYSSGLGMDASSGILGVGWSLTGLSQIARCKRTYSQDWRPATIRFDSSDAYCLNGMRLVPVPNTDGKEFRTEQDIFSRIVIDGADELGPTSFTVYTKDGRILTYGGPVNATLQGKQIALSAPNDSGIHAGAIHTSYKPVRYAWELGRAVDRFGNAIEYRYTLTEDEGVNFALEHLLDEIIYTSNMRTGRNPARSVRFYYYPRPDPQSGYVSGLKFRNTQLLNRIEMHAPMPSFETLVRSYELKYISSPYSGRSLLQHVQECDGKGICKEPTTFNWNRGDSRPITFRDIDTGIKEVWERDDKEYLNLQVGDVDCDGRDDIFFRQKVSTRLYWNQLLSRGDGFAYYHGSVIIPSGKGDGIPSGGRVLDYDMDGCADFIAKAPPNRGWVLYTGIAFDSPNRQTKHYFSLPYVSDRTGDGAVDLIYSNGEHWIAENTNYENGISSNLFLHKSYGPSAIDAWNHYSVDIDGDGADEFLIRDAKFDKRSKTIISGPRYSAWGQNIEFRKTTLLAGDKTLDTFQYFFLDMNGDSLADAVRVLNEGGNPDILLNSGNGFTDAVTPSPDEIVIGRSINPDGSDRDPGVRIIDMNRDGRQDLVLMGSDRPEESTILVLESQGSSLMRKELPIPIGQSLRRGGFKLSQPLDANGDGLIDFVQVIDNSLHLYLQEPQLPDVITSIADGFRSTVDLTYSPISDQSAYQPSDIQPIPEVKYPQYRVKDRMWVLTRSQHLGAQVHQGTLGANRSVYHYSYADGRMDLRGRGWLGFNRYVVREEETGAEVTTFFDNITMYTPADKDYFRPLIYPGVGRPVRMDISYPLNDGGQLSRNIIFRNRPVAGPSPRIYSVILDGSVTTDFEHHPMPGPGWTGVPPFRQVKVATVYDEFGNLKHQDMTTLRGEVFSWDFIYKNDVTNWLIGLPERIELSSRTPEGAQTTRVLRREYDTNTGTLRREYRDTSDQTAQLETLLKPNAEGLPEELILKDGNGQTRVERILYDQWEGIFPAQVTNALGHQTFLRFQAGLGMLVEERDPNDVTTLWTYDGFGRVRAENSPDSMDFSVIYEKRKDLNGLTAFAMTLVSEGGGTVVFGFDSLGRMSQRWQARNDGGWNKVRVYYDGVDRMLLASSPYLGNEPEHFTDYEYDSLGRIRFTRHPDHTYIEYQYDRFVTNIWDENRNQGRLVVDELGRPIESTDIDQLSGAEIQTTYTYRPFGLLNRITDDEENEWIIGYDDWGRRTSLVDPDTGSQQFRLNGFGEVLSEIKADGSTIMFEFDSLGRLREQRDQDVVTHFEWDTATQGIGQLAWSTSPDGILKRFEYDVYGRPAIEHWSVDGQTYLVQQSYDAASRLMRMTVDENDGLPPLGFLFEYGLDGKLAGVADSRDDWYFWQVLSRNAADQISVQRYSNGVETRMDFDPRRGLLIEQETKFGEEKIEHSLFQYDANTNLSRQVSVISGRQDDYTYDHLNRLKLWRVTQPAVEQVLDIGYEYDDLGNLRSRTLRSGSDILQNIDYLYKRTTGGPHAITSAVWDNTTVDEYRYDQQGRQEQRPGATIAYTSFDLPKRIMGAQNVFFIYDADQNRVMKRNEASGNSSVYINGIYERRQVGGEIYQVLHVPGEGRVVAQMVRKLSTTEDPSEQTLFLHPDHLGSIKYITDSQGKVIEERTFDPYGNPVDLAEPRLHRELGKDTPGEAVRNGFGAHEEEPELGLVNMQARMYDPRIGRFLSADVFIQAPFFGQSLNRYSYVLNNPINLIDPDGNQASEGGFEAYCPNICISTAPSIPDNPPGRPGFTSNPGGEPGYTSEPGRGGRGKGRSYSEPSPGYRRSETLIVDAGHADDSGTRVGGVNHGDALSRLTAWQMPYVQAIHESNQRLWAYYNILDIMAVAPDVMSGGIQSGSRKLLLRAGVRQAGIKTFTKSSISRILFKIREQALRQLGRMPRVDDTKYGNLLDSIFKAEVERLIRAGELPSTITVTRRTATGRFAHGADVVDTATNIGWDLTTPRSWMEHERRYFMIPSRKHGQPIYTELIPILYIRPR